MASVSDKMSQFCGGSGLPRRREAGGWREELAKEEQGRAQEQSRGGDEFTFAAMSLRVDGGRAPGNSSNQFNGNRAKTFLIHEESFARSAARETSRPEKFGQSSYCTS